MKRHPRTRKARRWALYGGAVLIVLLITVWLLSGFTRVYWFHPGSRTLVSVYAGQFVVERLDEMKLEAAKEQERTSRLLLEEDSALQGNLAPHVNSASQGDAYIMPYTLHWWFSLENTVLGTALALPLWAPVAVLLAVVAPLWYKDLRALRRIRAGRCANCGYSRTGIARTSVCPECGARTEST